MRRYTQKLPTRTGWYFIFNPRENEAYVMQLMIKDNKVTAKPTGLLNFESWPEIKQEDNLWFDGPIREAPNPLRNR